MIHSVAKKTKKFFGDIDYFFLLSATAWIWLSKTLIFSKNSQLEAVWIRFAESNSWVEIMILPLFATISVWVCVRHQDKLWRNIGVILIFVPALLFLLGNLALLNWSRSLAAFIFLLINAMCSFWFASKPRKNLHYLFCLTIFFSIWLIALVSFSTLGHQLSATLGSASLLLLFVGCLSLSFVCISSLAPKVRLLMLIPILGLLVNELEHPAETARLPGKPFTTVYDHHAFGRWLARRGDVRWYAEHGRSYPVFIVSSEGGGGFAAAHASGFLQSVQTKCSSFGQHIFALIGVSGGAVGNSEFHNRLDRQSGLNGVPRSELKGSAALHHDLAPWEPCDGTASIDSTFVSLDHLAPILGTMLFDEFVRRAFWLPSGRRNRATELAASFEKGIADQPFLQHFWTFFPAAERKIPNGLPALIQVTTDMNSGHIYPISPFFLNNANSQQYIQDYKKEHSNEQDITLAAATVASASFPYVTPSVFLEFSREDDTLGFRLLVDGGYADNSGNFTARMLRLSLLNSTPGPFRLKQSLHGRKFLEKLGPFAETNTDGQSNETCELVYNENPLDRVNWSNCKVHFSIVHLLIRAKNLESTVHETNSNFFLDPIRSIFKVRVGRSAQESSALLHEICSQTNCSYFYSSEEAKSILDDPERDAFLKGQLLQSVFTPSAIDLPLGWAMPDIGLSQLQERLLDVKSLQDELELPGSEVCLSCVTRAIVEIILTEEPFDK